MNREYSLYKFYYSLAKFFVGIFYWIKPVGRENIPDGPAIVCANHSSWCDPFLAAMAFSSKYHLHFMAKAELFRAKLLGTILNKIGSFSVDRKSNDLSAIKKTIKYLKKGEKVMIFPEGTRAAAEGSVSPKTGAVHIADKMSAPIIPVYIPRKKPFFKQFEIVIGKPYMLDFAGEEHDNAHYEAKACELMGKIEALPNITGGIR